MTTEREYWTPYQFYEDAVVGERQARARMKELRRQMVRLDNAVTASRAAQFYPGLSTGVLEGLSLMGVEPDNPLYASIALADLHAKANSIAAGDSDMAGSQEAEQRRTGSSSGIIQGDLPIVDQNSWLGRAKAKGAWWAPIVDPFQNAFQGFLTVANSGYDMTFGAWAFAEAVHRQEAQANIPISQRSRVVSPFAQMLQGNLPERPGTVNTPKPLLIRAIEERAKGNEVNLGDTWFLPGGTLAPETELRLQAGMDFEDAIANDVQQELGVPLGYEMNSLKAKYPIRFESGEEVPNSFGSVVASEIFDANDWGAKAVASILDIGAGILSDPTTYVGAGMGAVRSTATRILPQAAKGIGFTMESYLRTPGAVRALAGIRRIADNPTALNRALSRSLRVTDPAIVDMIGTAAKAGDDTLKSLLIQLADKGVVANTMEPINSIGYAMRKTFLRGLRDDGTATAASRLMGNILEANSSSRRVIPTLGAGLAGLGIRSEQAITMRNVGRIAGGGIGVKMITDYRPGFGRLVGRVARTLPVANGSEFVERLDDYARSFGLSVEQRNDLFRRAARQPEIRATMPMSATADAWALDQIAQGNSTILEAYGDLLVDLGTNSENPLTIVADVYRKFVDNAVAATGMSAKDANRLNKVLGKIFETTESMRLWAMEASGDSLYTPNAQIKVVGGGKRYVTATPQEITEALAFNVPLLEPRQVRMLMRRGGQMGLFGRVGRRFGLLSQDGVKGGRLLAFSEYVKRNFDEFAEPLADAVRSNKFRKRILNANTYEDLDIETIRWLEQAGIDSPTQFPQVKETAKLYEAAREAARGVDPAEIVIDATEDTVRFLDDNGKDILEALSEPSIGPKVSAITERFGAKTYNMEEALIRTLTKLQSGVWKPLVMLRPAYIFRVLGEEQVRMWYNGYRSIFNSPLSFIALAMSSRARNPHRFEGIARVMGVDLGKSVAAKGRQFVDDVEEFMARTFGVARTDLDGHYLSQVEAFRDAMYRGRHNAMMRGEAESYMGGFKELDFSKVPLRGPDGKVIPEAVDAFAFDILEGSDRPMARLAASALFLDNHPEGPEEAMRLLLNHPDYSLLRQVYEWNDGIYKPTATNTGVFDQGLVKAVKEAFAGDRSSPLYGMRATVSRTSEQLRGAVANPTLARQQAESYFSRVLDTIGAKYARRDINGGGLILNTGHPAEAVLDPETLASLQRMSTLYPNEQWWMMEEQVFDGPIDIVGNRKAGIVYNPAVLDEAAEIPVESAVERMFLMPVHGADGAGVVVTKVSAADDLLMRAELAIEMTPDGPRVLGITNLQASMWDDFNVGTSIWEAIERVEPGFMERTAVGEFLEMPINGKPLYEWFDDLNIQTSTVGIQDFTGNPRWGRSSVEDILKRKINGTEIRFIDYLTDPENFKKLPDELQYKLLARDPERFIDEGDVIRTANGDYALVEVGDGRVLDFDADGNMHVREAVTPKDLPNPEMDIKIKVVNEGKVKKGTPTVRHVDGIMQADEPIEAVTRVAPPSLRSQVEEGSFAEMLLDHADRLRASGRAAEADDMQQIVANGLGVDLPEGVDPAVIAAKVSEALENAENIVQGVRNAALPDVPPGQVIDHVKFPEGTNASLAAGAAVPVVSGRSVAHTSVGANQMKIVDLLKQSDLPQVRYGLDVTGPRTVVVRDRDAILEALDALPLEAKAMNRARDSLRKFLSDIDDESAPRLSFRTKGDDELLDVAPDGRILQYDDKTGRRVVQEWGTADVDEEVLNILTAQGTRESAQRFFTSSKDKPTKMVQQVHGLSREQANRVIVRRVAGTPVRSTEMSADTAMALRTVLGERTRILSKVGKRYRTVSGDPATLPSMLASYEIIETGGGRAVLKVYDAEHFNALLDAVWRGQEDTWEQTLNMVWRDLTPEDAQPAILSAKRMEARREALEGRKASLPTSLEKYQDAANWKPDRIYGDLNGNGKPQTIAEAQTRVDSLRQSVVEAEAKVEAAQAWLKGKKASHWVETPVTDLDDETLEALQTLGWRMRRTDGQRFVTWERDAVPVSNPHIIDRYRLGLHVKEVGDAGSKRSVYQLDIRELDQTLNKIDQTIARLSTYGKGTPEGKALPAIKEWRNWLTTQDEVVLSRRVLSPPKGSTITGARRDLKDAAEFRKYQMTWVDEESRLLAQIGNEIRTEGAQARDDITEAFTSLTEREIPTESVPLTQNDRVIRQSDQAGGGRWSKELDEEKFAEREVVPEGGRRRTMPGEKYQRYTGPAVLLRSQPRLPRHYQMVSNILDDVTSQLDEVVIPPSQTLKELGAVKSGNWEEVPTGTWDVVMYQADSRGRAISDVPLMVPGREVRSQQDAWQMASDMMQNRRTSNVRRLERLREAQEKVEPGTGAQVSIPPEWQIVYDVRPHTEMREVDRLAGTTRRIEDPVPAEYLDDAASLPESAQVAEPTADDAYAEIFDVEADPIDVGQQQLDDVAGDVADVADEELEDVGAAVAAEEQAAPAVERTMENRVPRETDGEGIFEITVPKSVVDFVNTHVPGAKMTDAGLLTIRQYDVDDIADILEFQAETGFQRNFAEKFRRAIERERETGVGNLPEASGPLQYRQPKAQTPPPQMADEAAPAPKISKAPPKGKRSLTGSIEHGGVTIKVSGNDIKTPLISPRRPLAQEVTIGKKLLALADDQDVVLTTTLSKPSRKRIAMYEDLGFEVTNQTKTKVTLRRDPGQPIPDEWPRGGEAIPANPVIDTETGGWATVDSDGELVGRAQTREEALEGLRAHVNGEISGRGSLTKQDLEEIFETMHESVPQRLASPAEARDALDRAGDSMLRSRFRPRPGWAGNGDYVGPPRGTPRHYTDIEASPAHHFPIPGRQNEWDMNALELMGTGKAYGDYVDDIAEAQKAGTRVDEMTGRKIDFDLDEMRRDAVSPKSRRRVQNEMSPWLRNRSRIEQWDPHNPTGIGRSKMRLPDYGYDKDRNVYERVVEAAFDIITARPANLLSRGPVWHDAYMEAVAELYPFGNQAAREQIIEYLRGQGLHGKNNEVFNLFASLFGQRNMKKMPAEKIEKMLLDQAREVQRAGWIKVGAVKLDEMAGVGPASRGIESGAEILQLAQGIAAERVKNLLFDAAQRNQFFEQFAILFPFGDAFVELLQRWTRAFTTSPYRMRNISRTGNVARGLNGGQYNDEGIYSQEAGLRYTDPYSKEDMILLPGSEWASKLMTGDPEMMKLGLNAQGLSPLSVSMIPGLGPVVTGSAGMFGRLLGDWNPADPLRNPGIYRQLFPYGLYDPSIAGEGFGGLVQNWMGFPSWLTRGLTGLWTSWDEQATTAKFGSEAQRRSLENTANEIMRVNASTGKWDITSSPQSQSEAAQMAVHAAARVEMMRSMGLFFFGANSPTFQIPNMERSDLANATDEDIHNLLTYLSPVAYAQIYQQMLDENGGDFLETAVQFEDRFGFNPAYVRTGKSVEVRPSPVSREGRLFFEGNADLVSSYPLAAYYLQPDPPAAEFNYEAFRMAFAEGERESISPREYARILTNAVGLTEYQKKRDLILADVEAGRISPARGDQLISEVRNLVEQQFPGFNQQPSVQAADPRDIAMQLDKMVEEMGSDLDRFQMGSTIKAVIDLQRGASYVSRDAGHGEWWWASSTSHPEAVAIRQSFRAAFEGLARRDPRAAILWNEVYSKIIPYGEPTRLKMIPDDPYFQGYFTEDDYESPDTGELVDLEPVGGQ